MRSFGGYPGFMAGVLMGIASVIILVIGLSIADPKDGKTK